MRVEVTSPRTDIGRGAHNDLVLSNESVSDAHAKLQLRETGWVIVDLDSTNGTYVGGRRVVGEQLLTGAPDLRFGDIKVSFRSMVQTAGGDKSTRAIAGVSIEQARRSAESRPARSSATPVRAPVPRGQDGKQAAGVGPVVLVLVLVAAVVAWWFFFRGA
jgi:pSer/pThr/pTyr-binding forkhead associated (FHA) protein